MVNIMMYHSQITMKYIIFIINLGGYITEYTNNEQTVKTTTARVHSL